MRRKNKGRTVLILLAFVLGFAVMLLARILFPVVLPEHLLAYTGLLAVLVSTAAAVTFMLIVLFIFRIGGNR